MVELVLEKIRKADRKKAKFCFYFLVAGAIAALFYAVFVAHGQRSNPSSTSYLEDEGFKLPELVFCPTVYKGVPLQWTVRRDFKLFVLWRESCVIRTNTKHTHGSVQISNEISCVRGTLSTLSTNEK